MLLQKEGYPEENEFVLCTVTAIHIHSVFVRLDEYDNKSGMIHISEVSPGRIRNIRDFVKESKKIVCKVLRVNLEKGHIDLSLRRVNEMQKKDKLNELKQEQLAENIVELVAKQKAADPRKVYDEVTSVLFEKYTSLFSAFEDVSAGKLNLEGSGIAAEIAKSLTDAICQRIKPVELVIGGELKIESYEPDGIEIIKSAVKSAAGTAEIKYKGAGVYKVMVKSLDYKDAEKNLKGFVDSIIHYVESRRSSASFERYEK